MASRSRHNRLAAAAFVVGAAWASWGVVATGCSAAGSGSAERPGGGGGSGGADASVSGGAAGIGGDWLDATIDTAPTCPSCSADLKTVLDCDGGATACGEGEVCWQGACAIKDACTVAAAARSTNGCDYWTLNLDNIVGGGCYAAYVANTWSTPAHLRVEHDGAVLPIGQLAKIPSGQGAALTYAPYDAVQGLAPGQVAILFLAQGAPLLGFGVCPAGITAGFAGDPAVHGTGKGKGFHITADVPVVAYQIYPYGGGGSAETSATLLLPTPAWDTNYVVAEGYAKTQLPDNWGQPSMDVIAMEDGTDVTLLPNALVGGGPGVPPVAAGQQATYHLARGEYLQISQDAELTGSIVQSNKPVGVFGGNSCMNIPASVAACDTAQQQIPPVRALGSSYAAVRYRGRKGGQDESVPWRLVGAVDGTQLTYTPAAPAGAPSALAAGELAEFDAPGPFVVASQDGSHPFYMSAHMTGGAPFDGEGDPETVNVVPTAQYLTSYVFFTDPTYSETNLVLVRAKGTQGFADVNLDCAGVVSGWTPLGSDLEWTRVDLVTGNFQHVGNCANGRHSIDSTAPFGITVWGWGSLQTFPFNTQYVSYAYPGGAGIAPINTVVVPATPK